MNIEIFDNTKTVERTLRLALQKGYADGVTLIAVDTEGKRVSAGSLVTIRPDGTLHLCGSINRGLGLDLDSGGYIKHN